MITELLLSPFAVIIGWIIQALPAMQELPDWMSYAVEIISWSLCFFPADVWSLVFANIWFWIVADLGWALIEWTYKKFPALK